MTTESLEITPDWAVALELPSCELKLTGCRGEAVFGIRVHGCAMHFACTSCTKRMNARVRESYQRFETMVCTNCKVEFNRNNYYETVKLNAKK